jgi:uncharacterized membrane protein YphA (DoxX/SURF4 family)
MKPALLQGIRLGIGLLYLFAGLGKIGNPPAFYASILDYQIFLPDSLLVFAAVTLPWIEVLTGLFLVFGFWLESSLLVTLVLNGAFLLLTAQAWFRGLEVNCGCFGALEAGGPLARVIELLERPSWATLKNALTLAGLVWIVHSTPGHTPQAASKE